LVRTNTNNPRQLRQGTGLGEKPCEGTRRPEKHGPASRQKEHLRNGTEQQNEVKNANHDQGGPQEEIEFPVKNKGKKKGHDLQHKTKFQNSRPARRAERESTEQVVGKDVGKKHGRAHERALESNRFNTKGSQKSETWERRETSLGESCATKKKPTKTERPGGHSYGGGEGQEAGAWASGGIISKTKPGAGLNKSRRTQGLNNRFATEKRGTERCGGQQGGKEQW